MTTPGWRERLGGLALVLPEAELLPLLAQVLIVVGYRGHHTDADRRDALAADLRAALAAASSPQEGPGGRAPSDCARCTHALAQHPSPNEWRSSCTECRCPGWWSQRHLIHLTDEDGGDCAPGCPTCAGLTWRADAAGRAPGQGGAS